MKDKHTTDRVSLNVGDRIFPVYDVPPRTDGNGKPTGGPLYSRANAPRFECEPEIVHSISDRGFPMVEHRGHVKADGSKCYFERTKFVCEKSIWSDQEVLEDLQRVIRNVRGRLEVLEKIAPHNPEMIRRYYAEINRLDSSLIGAIYI